MGIRSTVVALAVVGTMFAGTAGPAAAAEGEAPPTGPDHAATFERLKALAGTWTGRMEDPLNGPPVTVRYEVVSAGRALVEYQNPGTSYEMVNVYFLADGVLRVTHYCAAGNQPAYHLGEDSTAELAILEPAGGTGFDPAQDGHVRQGEIRFVAPDRIEERWTHFVGPNEMGTTHWFLARGTPPAAAP